MTREPFGWLVAMGLLCMVGCSTPGRELPSFPGAAGYGSTTPGGRGGRVIRVTSLEDNGPGTLRAAVNAAGPRIVVFAVGGRIHLTSPLMVGQPYLTVLGQTAPGGVVVTGSCLRMRTHDVILRGVRFRAGDDPMGGDPGERDALNFLGGPWPRTDGGDGLDQTPRNVIVDHCSFAWSVDESVGTWAPVGQSRIEDVTLSWCIFTEPLDASIHHKISHGANLLIGDNVGPVTVHHCLLAMGQFRHPAFKGGAKLEFINNLVYNWGSQAAVSFCDGVNDPGVATFIGNHYVVGPMSDAGSAMKFHQGKVYLRDNLGPRRTEDSQPQTDVLDVGHNFIVPEPPIALSIPHPDAPRQATAAVLARAGAHYPQRDRVDARTLRHFARRTGGPINSVEEAGGWPELPPVAPAVDRDSDGLPDAWEVAHGLDPKNPADSRRLAPSGYAWIEEWGNALLDAPAAISVSAGDPQQISLPAKARLDGFVWGADESAGKPSVRWSGPPQVTFSDAASAGTEATFAAPGTYVLSLRAEVAGRSAMDTVTLIVNPEGTPINQPPVVVAGPKLNQKQNNPQKLTWPVESVALRPTVNDDGLPAVPGRLTYRWELVDNARRGGGGRFDDPTRLDARLLVSEPGRYVCKLSVSDGQYTRSSTTTVEIAPPGDRAQPHVFISAPVPCAILPPTPTLRIEASTPPDENLAAVEFFVDGRLIGRALRKPFAIDWLDVAVGPHRLTARAVRPDGLARTSPVTPIWIAPHE